MPLEIALKKVVGLKKIHTFCDFQAAPELPELRRHNLIYGFNGCGKTTLSSVLQSLGKGKLEPTLPRDAEFEILLSDGGRATHGSLPDGLVNKVFVINNHFIEANFKWDESKAEPVFYIGEAQTDAAIQLNQAEAQAEKLRAYQSAAEEVAKAAESTFAEHKRSVARTIADQLNLGRRYMAPQLEHDYSSRDCGLDDTLSASDLAALRQIILKDDPDPEHKTVNTASFGIDGLLDEAAHVCSQGVEEIALDELKAHPDMYSWVRTGYEYHSSKSVESCIFCGNTLKASRMEAIARAIGDRVGALSDQANNCRSRIRSVIDAIGGLLSRLPNEMLIASALRAEFIATRENLESLLERLKQEMELAVKYLGRKVDSPSEALSWGRLDNLGVSNSRDEALLSLVQVINITVDRHNSICREFLEEKRRAINAVKRHYLQGSEQKYRELLEAKDDAGVKRAKAVSALREVLARIEELKRQVRAHGPAADRINSMIRLYLGHSEIQISPVDDGYQLLRHGAKATGSPSEGERTAIVLCYFIVMLGAEGRKLSDLIVVLDDPISSLDSRALNYASALIQSTLKDAGQLVVLTHNLQLMNEMKKWMAPRTESGLERRERDPLQAEAAIYFIETRAGENGSPRCSKIVEMPKYIREYESEYHYLFHQIVSCHGRAEGREAVFHSMPNIIRKALDVFLAFKVPGGMGFLPKLENISKKSGMDVARLRSLERLVQVESHADNLDDLVSLSPMTVEEVDEAIVAFLELIERTDSEHYTQMCRLCRS